MNKLFTTMLLLGGVFLVNALQAQDLKVYTPLFESLNKNERVQFLATLRNLTSKVEVADQLQEDLFKDLRNGLPLTNPTAGIDSLLQAWSAGRTELSAILGGNPSEFDSLEVAAILGGYDLANSAWLQNLQSIQTGFTEFKDSMQVDPAIISEAEAKYKDASTTMEISLDLQYQIFASAFLGTSSQSNERSWDKIVDNLLNDFGALEIGAGFQSLFASYYEEAPDSTTAMLVRFGSAPNYNNLWGAEWNVWASFKGNSTNQSNESLVQNTNGFQSLLAGGNVSFQFRPEVPFTHGVMRLITGVGANVGAYMPTRINPNKPASLDNQGKTTGFGPEVRLGFAVDLDKLSFYGYSNRSKGYVLRCPDFPYDSWQVVSGIQWEALHLRYAHGSTSWAKGENRHALYNEVSISVRIN
ncbi:hypothetical protein [Haliscomenobacter sp.]|uniref:hypothetical protein n=1 Tax=Haliscomenobacter sp. TaxID=2717303 RepID=UPI0035948416